MINERFTRRELNRRHRVEESNYIYMLVGSSFKFFYMANKLYRGHRLSKQLTTSLQYLEKLTVLQSMKRIESFRT